MKNSLFKFLFLSVLSISACYAQWTNIRTVSGNPVQCNNWGWVEHNAQTVWPNVCAPLQVKDFDGNVYSVDTTDKCKDNQIAMFSYYSGKKEIKFDGCARAGYQKSITMR